jgi:hypothetical protein
MIFLPRAVRVYFATAPVNLRKSFDGLSNEVRTVLVRDPLLCVVVRNVAAKVLGRMGLRGLPLSPRIAPPHNVRRSRGP